MTNLAYRKVDSVAITPKKVGFTSQGEVEVFISRFNKELVEISDLCAVLTSCHQKVRSLGFLNCPNGYRHEFYTCVPDSYGCWKRALSLAELLSRKNYEPEDTRRHKARKPSREDRKRLSVQISVSLLQLYQTQWITGEWGRA